MPTTVSPRILIVDDEVEITEILADLLSDDYDCLRASSAEEALVRLGEAEFHLVISDITMPGMSGLEMIPHVKKLSPDTVVVMISGMQTVESAIGALRLGAFDYLMKPFDLRQVGLGLAQHLGRTIDADDLRRGPPLGDKAGNVAGAAAEIVDELWRRSLDMAQQVDRRAQSRPGEFEVLRGIPSHP